MSVVRIVHSTVRTKSQSSSEHAKSETSGLPESRPPMLVLRADESTELAGETDKHTVPAAILDRDGKIEKYVKVPSTLGPGRRILHHESRHECHEPMPVPFELLGRPLPKEPKPKACASSTSRRKKQRARRGRSITSLSIVSVYEHDLHRMKSSLSDTTPMQETILTPHSLIEWRKAFEAFSSHPENKKGATDIKQEVTDQAPTGATGREPRVETEGQSTEDDSFSETTSTVTAVCSAPTKEDAAKHSLPPCPTRPPPLCPEHALPIRAAQQPVFSTSEPEMFLPQLPRESVPTPKKNKWMPRIPQFQRPIRRHLSMSNLSQKWHMLRDQCHFPLGKRQ